MLNKDGGVQADVTVSVLEENNAPSVLSPKAEGTVRMFNTIITVPVHV